MSNNVLSLETATRIVGYSNKRAIADFYPTPPWAVQALLDREVFNGSCWEPACGEGHISKVLVEAGHEAYSSDILDYGFGVSGIDFLNENPETHKRVQNIITNPPFNLAVEFINTSKRFADDKIAMFLKTTFLEGVKRQAMWKDRAFPFKKMYQFSKRVSFGKAGKTHKNGGMMAFAWFVWEKNYSGSPTIEWI